MARNPIVSSDTLLKPGSCRHRIAGHGGGGSHHAGHRTGYAVAGFAVSIDGLLDEAAWAEATEISIEYEWFPGNNITPPVRTFAYVTYDDRNLYVAFRAYDPDPSQIRAQLMDRDQIDTLVQNDYVIVQLDTFNDHRRSYQFRINPLGVQADAYSSEVDSAEDWSWDMIWTSKGRITDVGRSYPRSTRIWNWAVDYEDYGPGFRADNGFMPRVDQRKAQVIVRRTCWGEENSWHDRWSIGAYANHTEDHTGQLTGEAYLQKRKEYFDGILYEDLDGAGSHVERPFLSPAVRRCNQVEPSHVRFRR